LHASAPSEEYISSSVRQLVWYRYIIIR
jgi:hypothetical protein